MIPKTIHYCWFGRNPKPELALKCIESWKKLCPDYEIIEWNEENFDISACPLYVRQAYELKKWPFVTDYVRLKVVFDRGGIYLDTDVELKKSMDSLLGYEAFFGFEAEDFVATGLGFGAVALSSVLQEMMADYEHASFVLSDGTLDTLPCPRRNTHVLEEHGLIRNNTLQVLKGNILIMPREYMCPINYETGIMRCTGKTLSIHWYAAAWLTEEQKKKRDERQRAVRRWAIREAIVHAPNRFLMKLLGMRRYDKLKKLLK